MSAFNPLVQGWNNSPASAHAHAPSLFGALPSASTAQTPAPLRDTALYHLTDFKSTVLNATLRDAHGRAQIRVVTEPTPGRPTLWLDASARRTVALVDWGRVPSVEVPGLLARTAVRDWLRLSPDRTIRYMDVRGIRYFWAPEGPYISLYFTQERGAAALLLARVGKASAGAGATIEMTRQAMQYGLLEVCVVAATLFLSGVPLE